MLISPFSFYSPSVIAYTFLGDVSSENTVIADLAVRVPFFHGAGCQAASF